MDIQYSIAIITMLYKWSSESIQLHQNIVLFDQYLLCTGKQTPFYFYELYYSRFHIKNKIKQYLSGLCHLE